MRPDKASVIRNNKIEEVRPDEIKPGETIEVKAGERIALDGLLMDDEALFNTSALTGESIPRQINNGEEVAAGMISENKVVRLKVLRPASDSALSRILKMVEDASEKKAPSELLIRKLARIYTPIVTGLAILITLLPFLFSLINHSFNFIFDDWLYRSLFFLVLSCPCALVISIPLGYFGGIGAASKKGILFKGGNYLDAITKVNCVVFDKTGTLTRGVFEITSVNSLNNYSEEDVLKYAALAESKSTHPIATALLKYALSKGMIINTPRQITEKAGYGVETIIDGNNILAGNIRLMELYNISVPESLKQIDDTIICIAANNIMAGYILLADTLKEDSKDAVKELEKLNIKDLNILSGDKSSIVANIAVKLGIKSFKGDLLPAGKLEFTKDLKKDKNKVVAFVGDGINDAPVLALSDVGIAMGSMGSDAAIESADVVIQTDQPSKVAEAVKIGKLTKRIVYQNIIFAFGVKILVLLLGTMGIASLWEAVFADVGVSLIAILNALRLQNLMIKD